MIKGHNCVVRYADGRIEKGTTADFLPNRPIFHLLPLRGDNPIVVHRNSLKAVFFVKDFRGRPDLVELRGFLNSPMDNNQGRKVAVRFKDGEEIFGYTMTWSQGREAFFVNPADHRSNNVRIFVITDATEKIAVGAAADAMAESKLAAAPHKTRSAVVR